MKLTKLFMLFMLTAAVVGCSKDDDGNSEPAYQLTRSNFVDTYSLNFLETKVVETITFSNGSTSTSTTTEVGSIFQNVNYEFLANNTFTASGLYTTVKTIKHPDGSTETEDPVIVDLDKSGTYTLNPNTKVLILTDQDSIQTIFDISLYTQTEMRLFSESEITNGNSTIVTTQELRFTR